MEEIHRYEIYLGSRIDITWQLDFRLLWEYLWPQEEEWYIGVRDSGT